MGAVLHFKNAGDLSRSGRQLLSSRRIRPRVLIGINAESDAPMRYGQSPGKVARRSEPNGTRFDLGRPFL
jgi:hypothetical protein